MSTTGAKSDPLDRPTNRPSGGVRSSESDGRCRHEWGGMRCRLPATFDGRWCCYHSDEAMRTANSDVQGSFFYSSLRDADTIRDTLRSHYGVSLREVCEHFEDTLSDDHRPKAGETFATYQERMRGLQRDPTYHARVAQAWERAIEWAQSQGDRRWRRRDTVRTDSRTPRGFRRLGDGSLLA